MRLREEEGEIKGVRISEAQDTYFCGFDRGEGAGFEEGQESVYPAWISGLETTRKLRDEIAEWILWK